MIAVLLLSVVCGFIYFMTKLIINRKGKNDE